MKKNNWIPIEEGWPVRDITILVTEGVAIHLAYAGVNENATAIFFYDIRDHERYFDITHWMPLPRLPRLPKPI